MRFELAPGPGSPEESAVRDAERGIGRWTVIGLVILLLSFGLTIAWSTLVPLASAVVAPGVVKVDTSRKKIQHQEGGVIREILVRDGDRVKAGQVLIRLDETRAGASHGIFQAQYDAAIAQLSRLMAERDRLEAIPWPAELLSRKNDPKVAEILRSQESMHAARRASLIGQLEILDKQIAARQNEIQGIAGQRDAKEAQLKSLKIELSSLTDLLGKGMVEKTKYRTLEREIAQIEGERAEHVSDIAVAKSAIGEKELEKFQLRKGFHEDVVAELRKVQNEAFDYLERMGAAKYVLAQTELKAPVDGIAVDLKAHTLGGVIAPGEVLLDIVPTNDRLIIEAQVRPEDIDRVRLDLDAGVQLAAFDRRATPELNGKVRYVSADAIEDPVTGRIYFVTKIEVPESELARLGDQKVQPGMLADVFMRTGKRTFVDYLLHPIIASFDKAWRER
ncbi:HlyD family type I secretion periplasmic adaptor subunit [Aromatoleum anaerobium]|uniref:Membrane fusion protein (MFP) family protein n=1 Tax=Aromatoleum anaerobium TaxID=182180 RepID=A0ABX1PM47_9RHOO|nr:HlyD family type I secretion periplasmic adaptor subunit [Aromatoleum anaerobium]MCK0505603.1 HlyD family type I secretion periplasmic adaptor subunit [Aromatoleum anaerobium]